MSTERVEINPDNNNKTLEQSQEDLAKQGVNVNEGVVNNNGESVNISQPENTTQSTDQQARPNWLPEKFKSAEEQALKELLVEYSNEYEYICSIGREHRLLPTEAEMQSKIQQVCDKLGWTLEEGQEYSDFIANRY